MTGIKLQKLSVGVMLLTYIFISSCASEKRLIKSLDYWLGRPYQEVREINLTIQSYHSKIGKKENPITLKSGNKEYEQIYQGGKCIVLFQVNSNGFIIGYRYSGSYCKLPPDLL